MAFLSYCAFHALISAATFSCVAAVHVPALRYNVNKSREVLNLEDDEQCPPGRDPSILFMHIEKTGGTVMRQMLKATIASMKKYEMIDGEKPGRLTGASRDENFVIGLVRRPCDYLLSRYYMGLYVETKDRDEMEKLGNKADFKRMVMRTTDETLSDRDKKIWNVDHYLMSRQIQIRYGNKHNAHCWMRTHNLKSDFIDCVRQFQACGGKVKNNGVNLDKLVEDAMVDTARDMARDNSRSVGNHPACTEMFDEQMLARVLKTQQRVIDEYDLEQCCSSNPKSLLRDSADAELSPFFDLDWQID